MNIIYPGSLWAKRFARVLIIFTIGANLFLNRLQDTLLKVGGDMVEITSDLSRPAADAAILMEENVLPFLEHCQSTPFGQKATAYFELPDTQALYEGIGQVHRFHQMLGEYSLYFSLAAKVLRLTSLLFWIPIGLACTWLGLDLFYSKSRAAQLFVTLALTIAVPFNIVTFKYLKELFPMTGGSGFEPVLQMLH